MALRAIAWVYVGLHIVGLATWLVPPEDLQVHIRMSYLGVLIVVSNVAFLLFWACLLLRKKWAWGALVVLFSIHLLAVPLIVRSSYRAEPFGTLMLYLVNFSLLGGIGRWSIVACDSRAVLPVVLAAAIILPLCVLLIHRRSESKTRGRL